MRWESVQNSSVLEWYLSGGMVDSKPKSGKSQCYDMNSECILALAFVKANFLHHGDTNHGKRLPSRQDLDL